MKLRKMHLADGRMLSNEESKFVIGGEGGVTVLPEVYVYARHTKHDGSFADCYQCLEYLIIQNMQNYNQNGDGNEYNYTLQWMLNAYYWIRYGVANIIP